MVGVRGCGKTTLIRSVLPKLSHFEYVCTETVIASLVGSQYPQFSYFPDEIKKQVRSRAIMYMKEETERFKSQLIVEDHTTMYNPHSRRIERILPEEASFVYTDLILHSVEPTLVLQRRRSDPTVKRTLDLDFIEQEVLIEETESRRYADLGRLDLHILKDYGDLTPPHALLKLLQGYSL